MTRRIYLPFALLFADYIVAQAAWLLACALFGWQPFVGMAIITALALAGVLYIILFFVSGGDDGESE